MRGIAHCPMLHVLTEQEKQGEAVVDSMDYRVFNFDGEIFEGKDGNLYALVYLHDAIYKLNGNDLGPVLYCGPQMFYKSMTKTGYDYALTQFLSRRGRRFRTWRVFRISEQKEYTYTFPAWYFNAFGFNAERKVLVAFQDSVGHREVVGIDFRSRPRTTRRVLLALCSMPNVDRLLVAYYDASRVIRMYDLMEHNHVATIDVGMFHIYEVFTYYPLAPNIVILLGMSDHRALFIIKDRSIVFQLPLLNPHAVYSVESIGNRCIIGICYSANDTRYIYANLDNERFCILSDVSGAGLLCSGVVVRLKPHGLIIIPTADLERNQVGLIRAMPSRQSALALL